VPIYIYGSPTTRAPFCDLVPNGYLAIIALEARDALPAESFTIYVPAAATGRNGTLKAPREAGGIE